MKYHNYQRSHCNSLCPRLNDLNRDCSLCRVLDEADRFYDWLSLGPWRRKFWSNPWWYLWQYSGVREICALANPNWKAATEPKPSILTFWIVGVVGAMASAYVAVFGLASTRYEARLDQIENRVNGIYALSGSKAWKAALERIPSIQQMTLPEKPKLFDPLSIFNSLVIFPESGSANIHKGLDVLEDLKELIESFNRATQSFENINLRGAQLSGVNLKGARLSEARLSGAHLSKANLGRADLRGAGFLGADLREADLRQADLRRVDFRGAHLREADLLGADLRGAQLSGADLRGAHLRRADLRGASLLGADLLGARLFGALLLGADLREADLRQADLREANLSRADLRKADLHETDLRGADLSSANLSGLELRDIKWNQTTIWPDGSILPPSR